MIFFSLAFAFSTWSRTVILVLSHIINAYLNHWIGAHKISFGKIYRTSALKKLEREKIEELDKRALKRKLSEIKTRDVKENDKDLSLDGRGAEGRHGSTGSVIMGFRNRRSGRRHDSDFSC